MAAGMFGMQDPYEQMRSRWEQESKAATQLGPGYAAGLLARQGMTGLTGAMGMKQPEQVKQEKLKAIVAESRDPGGDMSKTLENLARRFGEEGMIAESVKATEMLQAYKQKQLDMEKTSADIKNTTLNTESLVEDRAAKARIAKLVAENKILGKPWGEKALSFYYSKANAFTPQTWEKWWAKMQETNGDAAAAANILENYDQDKDVWTDPYTDPITGKRVQRNKRTNAVRAAGGDEASSVTVKAPGPQLPQGVKGIKDVGLAAHQIRDMVKPQLETLNLVSDIRPILAQAENDNTVAGPGLVEKVVRLFKSDSNMAKSEAERLRNTGPLGQRLASMIESFVSGTITQYKVGEIKALINAMERNALTVRSRTLGDLYNAYKNEVDENGKPVNNPAVLDNIFQIPTYGPLVAPPPIPAPKRPGAPAAPKQTPEEMGFTMNEKGNWVYTGGDRPRGGR